MSEKFSATLRIGDLNDFIAPSQSCIVSVKGRKSTPAKRTDQPEVVLASLINYRSLIWIMLWFEFRNSLKLLLSPSFLPNFRFS